jgi:hypothetical protein
MAVFTQYDSSSPDLVEEIDKAATNPTVIARQHRHFVQSGTDLTMSDPEWDLTPLAPLLDEMTDEADFGTDYDYMPDKMSWELYGTHELWPVLLRLNKAMTRAQFRGPRLKFIRADMSNKLLSMLRFGINRAEAADKSMPVVGDLTVKKVYV